MGKIKTAPISTILCLICCVNANAQIIRGKVVDDTTREPLNRAAVEIRSFGDDAYIAGGSTDAKGEFELRLKETYSKIRVSVTFLGYKPVQKVYVPDESRDYLDFEMQEESHTMDEVVVKGLSPAERVQRLAYNVSLVETAKANGIEPYGYLLLVLSMLPYLGKSPTHEELEKLMPWRPAVRHREHIRK